MDNTFLKNVVLATYENEPCRICGVLLVEEDLLAAVFAGYDQSSRARAAHLECWQKYPATQSIPHSKWKHK